MEQMINNQQSTRYIRKRGQGRRLKRPAGSECGGEEASDGEKVGVVRAAAG